ncbi:DNA polymerase III subunit alpha [Mycoplasmopsis opalescens]|uniref:DNA polymerase III subunit alpha n=1 Tax=Mycoplasmopsis opalescens TaxID=114886 RepID=UPI0004A7693C|nr:DNA polymerase III subunit alpha [Mycoplasmopsis opalescens]
MKKFTNLYNTTHYSFLDSLIKLEDLYEIAKKNNLDAVVLSDHNNLFGLGEHLNLSKKYDIKPIIGLDLDVGEYRFILLAKNYLGYQKLNKLSFLKSKNETITVTDINDNNLFILDHPIYGYYAKEKKILPIFKDNYFINSSDPNLPNSIVLKVNKLILASDCDALNVIQEIGNNEKDTIYYDYENDISVDEIIIDRIDKIIAECNVIFPEKQMHLASYENKTLEENIEYFNNLLEAKIIEKQRELSKYPDYLQRVKYEKKVIIEQGFVNYFLIIQDLVNWAKNQRISVGPGRGSAAGSLISYLFNITTINPLQYNLLFERFLNPARSSWPDIDIDLQDNRRMEVFEYLKNKYGSAYTALISTFQTVGAKTAIRDAGRILKIPLPIIDRISKSIRINESLDEAYLKNKDFKIEISQYQNLYQIARKIEGLIRQQSYHPAGFIIADKPIIEYAPLCLSGDETFNQVQLPMDYVEDFGLIKIDLLGLKTLTEIQDIESKLDKELHFENVLQKFPLDIHDPSTLNMLNKGFTEGIFQLESAGMKNTIKKVNLDSFDDVYALISLFRPGPMANIDIYANNKKYPSKILKIHPAYDKIVGSTFGIIVYQEQIMQIAQEVANLSPEEADFLRRAISKKNEDKIKLYKEKFYYGAYQNGLSIDLIDKIYLNILRFAEYGFNKSHAVSYAFLTMKMAYYKARYAHLFYSSLITNANGSQTTILKYVNELRKIKYPFLSPNIKYSTNECTLKDNAIVLPLNMIKGFGNESINKIIIARNNQNFDDNLAKTLLKLRFAGIKDAAMETLIKANTFRDYGNVNFVLEADHVTKHIYNMFANYKTFEEAEEKINQNGYITIEFDTTIEQDIKAESEYEKQLLGACFNIFNTTEFEKRYQYRLLKIPNNTTVFVAAELIAKKEFPGKSYGLLEFQDSSGTNGFFVSNNEYKRSYAHMNIGSIIELEIENKNNKLRLLGYKTIN